MSEWTFAQHDDKERLCKIEHFGMIYDGVEFLITVREYLTPPDPMLRFYATADKETNQESAPFTPVTLFYVFVYTIWLKPRTPQNIVIGGAAGAVPVLVGWAVAHITGFGSPHPSDFDRP